MTIVNVDYRSKALNAHFFFPLIKTIFQHQHIQCINDRFAICIFNMRISFQYKPNTDCIDLRHVFQKMVFIKLQRG